MSSPSRSDQPTLADAEPMLAAIPAHERDVWVRVGMAMKAEFDDDGLPAWLAWSASAENYVERDALAVWRSIRPDGGITLGSLVHLAREHGWRPGADQRPRNDSKAPPPTTLEPSRTAVYARELWLAAEFDDAVVGTHPYAVRKGIDWAAGAGRVRASGRVIGRDADCLVVPIRTDSTGKVQAVQAINAEGAKQTFGNMAGGCLVLGNTLDVSMPWYVAEGWASAVSVVFHHHRGNAVCAAAFGKGRLEDVAKILERVFDPPVITILEECD